MNYAIFISYRRDGGAYYARILKAELEKRGYKDRVFLDYDELNDGRFDSRIMHAIECAPIFIFILSPGALDRCTNDNDWVRREIIYAMEHERQIVPVNCDGLFKEFPKTIPLEIKNILGQHQFSEINYQSLLNESIEKLIKYRIAPIISPIIEGVKVETGAEIHICTDTDCSIMRFGKHINTAKTDEDCIIHLLKGNHILEFVSTEFPEVKKQIRYSVPDNEYSDFIEIGLQSNINNYKATLDLIKVTDGNKEGYIDIFGREIIPCKYSEALNFYEDLAAVKNFDNKWGFINKAGEEIVPCRYLDISAYNFPDGVCAVKNLNNKWGFINKNGEEFIPCKYTAIKFFVEGVAAVSNLNNKWGFINRNGEEIIPCKYLTASLFIEGLAAVKNLNGKCGFINKAGEEIIPCRYYDCGDFHNNRAWVVDKNRKYGFIDKNGNEIIQCKYDYVNNFINGYAVVRNENGLHGVIDAIGRVIIPLQYLSLFLFHENGLTLAQNCMKKWGFINNIGKESIPFIYEDAAPFYDGLAEVKDKNGNYGFINENGDEVIPCIWKNSRGLFHDGLKIVKDNNGKFGYINKKGEIIIPCLYSDADEFHNGVARVKMDEKEMIINKNGEIIWPQEKR